MYQAQFFEELQEQGRQLLYASQRTNERENALTEELKLEKEKLSAADAIVRRLRGELETAQGEILRLQSLPPPEPPVTATLATVADEAEIAVKVSAAIAVAEKESQEKIEVEKEKLVIMTAKYNTLLKHSIKEKAALEEKLQKVSSSASSER